jgi:DNA-binding transcriptional LysR family regulator
MRREDFSDLVAFVAIAEQRSFKKAADKLGVSSSALSHTMKALEARLGVRLLQRTTRSVAPTDAGERLLASLRPAMASIEEAVATTLTQRATPSGNLRITVSRTAALRLLVPKLPAFCREHPGVTLELSVADHWVDIVESRFDAGVRLGESVAKDMIAVQIGPPERAAVVGSPDYFRRHPPPQTPHDLAAHDCVNYRFVGSGALYRWEFEHAGRALTVATEGSFICNDADLLVAAALSGLGLVYSWESEVAAHLASGALVRVLGDWCAPFPGNYLYYPSGRHMTPALRAFVDAVRL